jgi:hypothetical protein
MEVSADQLKHAVEAQQGGTAVWVGVQPVKEVFEGKTVWEGVIHVFNLEDHPGATRPMRGPRLSMAATNDGSSLSCIWATSARR